MIEASRTFAASTDSVAAARRFVAAQLGPAETDTHDVVVLLVSELATNALVHGGTDFTLVVQRDDDRLRVSVTDGGTGTPQARRPGPEDLTGRGLLLVGRLADHWGVVPGADGGKTVWFELAVPDRSSAPADRRERASSEPADDGAEGSAGRDRHAVGARRLQGGGNGAPEPGPAARARARLRCRAGVAPHRRPDPRDHGGAAPPGWRGPGGPIPLP